MAFTSMIRQAFRRAVLQSRSKTGSRKARIRLDSLENRLAPAIGTMQFQATSSSNLESTTPTVTVQLQTNDFDLIGTVTVDVADIGSVAGVAATGGGVDYSFTTQQVSFAVGDSYTLASGQRNYFKTVGVTLTDDRRVESTENTRLELQNLNTPSDGITLTGGGNLRHTFNITDNDSAVVSIPNGTTTDSENTPGSANLTATLDITAIGTGTEELAVTVTANLPTGNAEYTPTGITFNPGAADGLTADIVVAAVDDLRVETSTESIPGQALIITSTGGADVTASGVQQIDVTDNDSAQVAIPIAGSMTKVEGQSENVVATLTLVTVGTVGSQGLDVSVAANLPGNADYTPTGVTFNPGDPSGSTANISVLAVDDNLVEATETFLNEPLIVTTTAQSSSVGTETIIITDNDTATFTIDDVTVTEGGTITFTVTLSNPIDIPVQIDVNYGGGTATGGGTDYDSATDSLTFPASSTASQQVTVTTNDDNVVEATETFIASLSTPTALGGRTLDLSDTGTGTITDNDTATFTIDDVTVTEGGTITFTVTLSNPIDIPVQIDVNYGGGTATGGGTDYDSATDSLTFPASSTASQQVTVTTNDDNVVEATETFVASLSTPTALGGRTLDLSDTGTGTITDNDTATFTIDDVTVTEGGTITFTVTLSNPIDIPVQIDVNYGGGTATGGGTDYDSATDSLTFPASSTASQQVTVTTNDDNVVEATETFIAQPEHAHRTGRANA